MKNLAQKNIYEFDAKKLLASQLPKYYPEFEYHNKLFIVDSNTNLDNVMSENQWVY